MSVFLQEGVVTFLGWLPTPSLPSIKGMTLPFVLILRGNCIDLIEPNTPITEITDPYSRISLSLLRNVFVSDSGTGIVLHLHLDLFQGVLLPYCHIQFTTPQHITQWYHILKPWTLKTTPTVHIPKVIFTACDQCFEFLMQSRGEFHDGNMVNSFRL
jgi:hypothetical protein